MKHAYLIIANKNPAQLQLLINMIDDSRNDIYVLVDKKSKNFPNSFNSKKSNLYMLPRMCINWGDYTQIKAEMSLLKESQKHDRYDYFHLLSGQDLPLVNQDKIHEFFDENPNKEFISYNKMVKTNLFQFVSIKIRDKIKKRKHKFLSVYKTSTMISARRRKHFFKNKYRNNNALFILYRKIENNILFLFPSNYNIGFSSQWFSIDRNLANSLINSERTITNQYKNGVLVDEVFLPTFINENKEFKDKVFLKKSVKDRDFRLTGNLRYINWTSKSLTNGSPEIIRYKDYGKLCEARKKGFLFARKFDESKDSAIIKKIYNDILNS